MAAEHYQSSAYNHTPQDHSASFASMLHQDMSRDSSTSQASRHEVSKHDGVNRHEGKEKKTGQSSGESNTTSADSAATAKAKPSLTGKVQLLSQGESEGEPDGQDADMNADSRSNALLTSTPDSLLAKSIGLGANTFDGVSGTELSREAGSLLMAFLLKTQGSGLTRTRSDVGSAKGKTPFEESLDRTGSSTPLNPAAMASGIESSSDSASKGENLRAGAVEAAGSSPLQSTAGSEAPESSATAAAMPGQLAFALRLHTAMTEPSAESAGDLAATPQSGASLPETQGVITAPAGLPPAPAADLDKKNHSGNEDQQERASSLATVDVLPQGPSHSNDAAPEADAPVARETSAFDEQLQNYSTEPVRNVLMQVVGEDNRRVDIRLVDRAGEMRVSVKTGDSQLNKTLQSQMPELTSRLEAARYQTESWIPGQPQSATEQDGDSSSNGEQQGPNDRPAWVDGLDGATPQNRKVQ